MTLVFGDLGQSSPAAGVLGDVYTVPAMKRATVRAVAANRGAATTFRLALAPGGAADDPDHYKAWEVALGAGEALEAGPWSMAAGDVIRGRSASGDVTFTINVIEEDV